MAKVRLGKRERQALAAVRDGRNLIVKTVVNYNLTHDRDPAFLHTKGGSSDSVEHLMSHTHQGFRSNLHVGRDKMALADDKRVIATVRQHVGRVERKAGWVKQAPLPTDHSLLLSLERGHKVAPVEDDGLPDRPMYATAPTVKRFAKTK